MTVIPVPFGTDTPDAVLTTAADYLAEPESWGTGWFITADGSRCALGAITWAVAPDDADGDPRYHTASIHAAELLARYLISERNVPVAATGDDKLDVIETVGDWNDSPGRTAGEVIAALRAAADYAEANS